MNIIYEPQGAAKEFAELAINHYKGCSGHFCSYCFGPATMRKSKEAYHADSNPKDNIIPRLRHDCKYLHKQFPEGVPEVLVSFIGDPYQPADQKLIWTRRVLTELVGNDIPFTILTKGGVRAIRDFDLLRAGQARFGTSLVWDNQQDIDTWESGTALLKDRIRAIEIAKSYGIPTWVSLEPVIDPNQAVTLIRGLHSIVDHWKIGKINHNKKLESQVDWVKFRDNMIETLEMLGADYYIKKSLSDLK